MQIEPAWPRFPQWPASVPIPRERSFPGLGYFQIKSDSLHHQGGIPLRQTRLAWTSLQGRLCRCWHGRVISLCFPPMAGNVLYYGDNLGVLKESIKDESIDLVYLDPPFNSQTTYNVLFKAPSGEESHAQIEAFEDTWHWGESAEQAFDAVMGSGNSDAAELLRALRAFLHENDMMAYLTMLAIRLIELQRVLKSTGSLYLHCDPTASHYLKLLLDATFEPQNFRNEIVWKRT